MIFAKTEVGIIFDILAVFQLKHSMSRIDSGSEKFMPVSLFTYLGFDNTTHTHLQSTNIVVRRLVFCIESSYGKRYIANNWKSSHLVVHYVVAMIFDAHMRT